MTIQAKSYFIFPRTTHSKREIESDAIPFKSATIHLRNNARRTARAIADRRAHPALRRVAPEPSSDPYRPVYHYVNPEGPSNDPNGFTYWQGRHHLFYQQYPPEDRRQHWGHAVSEDLVYWQDLPIAIYPGIEEKCYSGSCLAEDDRVLACYHGTSAGTMIATATDPLLLNWEKIPGNPVIAEVEGAEPGSPYRVGDPCLWKGKKGYYSLSGSFQGKLLVDAQPLPHLFFSEDLRNWTYLGPFLEDDVFTTAGEDCAVPYFWPIGDKHILVFGSHQRGAQYLLGDWDEEAGKFRPFAHDRFCFGPINNGGVNAPTATPDNNGGVHLMHMLNHGMLTGDWNGIMSLPTRLSLGPGNTVINEPIAALEALRTDHRHIGKRSFQPTAMCRWKGWPAMPSNCWPKSIRAMPPRSVSRYCAHPTAPKRPVSAI